MAGLGAALLAAPLAAPAADSPALQLARQLNDAFTEIAEKASPSVVVITVDVKPDENARADQNDGNGDGKQHHRWKGRERTVAQGSGVILTEDGYILTNDHVVEDAEQIHVRLKDGTVFNHVQLKGTDPESDIAVIKIPAKGLAAAKLGDSDKTRVGEFVLAIGAPFELTYSVTVGHVSAKGRSFEMEAGGYSDQDFIQTDASINPGNSGGPLVNLYGEVVAINAMIEGENTGIGFAIPINLAKRVSSHLISEGKYTRSVIGVGIGELADYKEAMQGHKNLLPDAEQGVLIDTVFADTPASRSNLKPGDVVVAVDAKGVKTGRELKEEIAGKHPGQVIVLSVVRGRDHLDVKVKTEALHPDEAQTASAPHSEGAIESAAYGLKVETLTRDLARKYGVDTRSGVVVSAVEENSPADDHNIKKGDVITEVNRKAVSSVRQFREAIKAFDGDASVALSVISRCESKVTVTRGAMFGTSLHHN